MRSGLRRTGNLFRSYSLVRPRTTTAVEVLDYRAIEVPEDIRRCRFHEKLLLTCEHASNHLPLPYRWSTKDRLLRDTHWGYDPGAAQVLTLNSDLSRARSSPWVCGSAV